MRSFCHMIGRGFTHGGEGEALEVALEVALGVDVAAPLLGIVSRVVSWGLCSSFFSSPVRSGAVKRPVLSPGSAVGLRGGTGGTAGE